MTRIRQPAEQILPGRKLSLAMVRSVASLQSRSASRITWHHHAGFECLYLLDGATEYEFDDGRSTALPGGSFLVVPPGVRHRGLQDVRKPARLCSIQVTDRIERGRSTTPFAAAELRWMFEQLHRSQRNAVPMHAELRRLTKNMADRIRDFKSDHIEKVAGLRLLICEVMLETAKQLTSSKHILPSEAVQAAVRFMEEHYAESLSIGDIATRIDFSRSRLFEAFKTATGLTPNDYLQRIRLAKAAELLASTNLPITTVAMECGFSTSQYFSYSFSKYHNLSPRQFRNQRTSCRTPKTTLNGHADKIRA